MGATEFPDTRRVHGTQLNKGVNRASNHKVEVSHPVLTFRLEGSLTGPWLQELEDCWQRSLDCQRTRTRLIDLTEVTFVDAAGKACLAAMHRQGAEFTAADCMTKAIVAEIERHPLDNDRRVASSAAKTHQSPANPGGSS